jgi:hypothetical protein
MRSIIRLAVCASVSLLTLTVKAQIITDPVAATAARDSLLQRVDATREHIAKNAVRFNTSAPRTAAARHVVRGYYLTPSSPASKAGRPTSSRMAWKHVTKTSLSGATNERYTGYGDNGLKILRERRHNGSITWVKLLPYPVLNGLNGAGPRSSTSGDYTREGYVRWGAKQYLAPRLTTAER